MATILAGTAYSQLVHLEHTSKKTQKQLFGALDRSAVTGIGVSSDGTYYYSTPKKLYTVSGDGTREAITLYEKPSIIGIECDQQLCRYCLSNGGIFTTTEKEGEGVQLFEGQGHTGYVGVCSTKYQENYLFYGSGVVPRVESIPTGLPVWWGKNVRHDELDMQVPINDVDGKFINDDKGVAIINASNGLRIYDIRGTHRRPVKEATIQTGPQATLTKLAVSDCDNYFYMGSTRGDLIKTDRRKDWGTVWRYKGVTTEISGLKLGGGMVVASSLDCNVRVFAEETRQLVSKYYLNKPISYLFVNFHPQHQQEEQFQVQELSEEQEVNNPQPAKIKQIRKRNKVGLKYLAAREFDTPPEVKEEEVQTKKWYEDLNPKDRKQFQEN